MSNEEQEERIDSIMAGISHSRLRSGTLTKDEWTKLERSVKEIAALPPMTLSADASYTSTLSGIAAKIDAVQPGIVFVDGVYMMQDEQGQPAGSPQALTNLTRGFKRLAMNRRLPINISTQVLTSKMSKTKGITADSIGYSSSFQQDADNIIGVLPTEDENVQEISIVLSRNCPKLKVYVAWDWETGQFEELQSDVFDPGGV
jgi:replicative DNA helicase